MPSDIKKLAPVQNENQQQEPADQLMGHGSTRAERYRSFIKPYFPEGPKSTLFLFTEAVWSLKSTSPGQPSYVVANCYFLVT